MQVELYWGPGELPAATVEMSVGFDSFESASKMLIRSLKDALKKRNQWEEATMPTGVDVCLMRLGDVIKVLPKARVTFKDLVEDIIFDDEVHFRKRLNECKKHPLKLVVVVNDKHWMLPANIKLIAKTRHDWRRQVESQGFKSKHGITELIDNSLHYSLKVSENKPRISLKLDDTTLKVDDTGGGVLGENMTNLLTMGEGSNVTKAMMTSESIKSTTCTRWACTSFSVDHIKKYRSQSAEWLSWALIMDKVQRNLETQLDGELSVYGAGLKLAFVSVAGDSTNATFSAYSRPVGKQLDYKIQDAEIGESEITFIPQDVSQRDRVPGLSLEFKHCHDVPKPDAELKKWLRTTYEMYLCGAAHFVSLLKGHPTGATSMFDFDVNGESILAGESMVGGAGIADTVLKASTSTLHYQVEIQMDELVLCEVFMCYFPVDEGGEQYPEELEALGKLEGSANRRISVFWQGRWMPDSVGDTFYANLQATLMSSDSLFWKQKGKFNRPHKDQLRRFHILLFVPNSFPPKVNKSALLPANGALRKSLGIALGRSIHDDDQHCYQCSFCKTSLDLRMRLSQWLHHCAKFDVQIYLPSIPSSSHGGKLRYQLYIKCFGKTWSEGNKVKMIRRSVKKEIFGLLNHFECDDTDTEMKNITIAITALEDGSLVTVPVKDVSELKKCDDLYDLEKKRLEDERPHKLKISLTNALPARYIFKVTICDKNGKGCKKLDWKALRVSLNAKELAPRFVQSDVITVDADACKLLGCGKNSISAIFEENLGGSLEFQVVVGPPARVTLSENLTFRVGCVSTISFRLRDVQGIFLTDLHEYQIVLKGEFIEEFDIVGGLLQFRVGSVFCEPVHEFQLEVLRKNKTVLKENFEAKILPGEIHSICHNGLNGEVIQLRNLEKSVTSIQSSLVSLDKGGNKIPGAIMEILFDEHGSVVVKRNKLTSGVLGESNRPYILYSKPTDFMINGCQYKLKNPMVLCPVAHTSTYMVAMQGQDAEALCMNKLKFRPKELLLSEVLWNNPNLINANTTHCKVMSCKYYDDYVADSGMYFSKALLLREGHVLLDFHRASTAKSKYLEVFFWGMTGSSKRIEIKPYVTMEDLLDLTSNMWIACAGDWIAPTMLAKDFVSKYGTHHYICIASPLVCPCDSTDVLMVSGKCDGKTHMQALPVRFTSSGLPSMIKVNGEINHLHFQVPSEELHSEVTVELVNEIGSLCSNVSGSGKCNNEPINFVNGVVFLELDLEVFTKFEIQFEDITATIVFERQGSNPCTLDICSGPFTATVMDKNDKNMKDWDLLKIRLTVLDIFGIPCSNTTLTNFCIISDGDIFDCRIDAGDSANDGVHYLELYCYNSESGERTVKAEANCNGIRLKSEQFDINFLPDNQIPALVFSVRDSDMSNSHEITLSHGDPLPPLKLMLRDRHGNPLLEKDCGKTWKIIPVQSMIEKHQGIDLEVEFDPFVCSSPKYEIQLNVLDGTIESTGGSKRPGTKVRKVSGVSNVLGSKLTVHFIPSNIPFGFKEPDSEIKLVAGSKWDSREIKAENGSDDGVGLILNQNVKISMKGKSTSLSNFQNGKWHQVVGFIPVKFELPYNVSTKSVPSTTVVFKIVPDSPTSVIFDKQPKFKVGLPTTFNISLEDRFKNKCQVAPLRVSSLSQIDALVLDEDNMQITVRVKKEMSQVDLDFLFDDNLVEKKFFPVEMEAQDKLALQNALTSLKSRMESEFQSMKNIRSSSEIQKYEADEVRLHWEVDRERMPPRRDSDNSIVGLIAVDATQNMLRGQNRQAVGRVVGLFLNHFKKDTRVYFSNEASSSGRSTLKVDKNAPKAKWKSAWKLVDKGNLLTAYCKPLSNVQLSVAVYEQVVRPALQNIVWCNDLEEVREELQDKRLCGVSFDNDRVQVLDFRIASHEFSQEMCGEWPFRDMDPEERVGMVGLTNSFKSLEEARRAKERLSKKFHEFKEEFESYLEMRDANPGVPVANKIDEIEAQLERVSPNVTGE